VRKSTVKILSQGTEHQGVEKTWEETDHNLSRYRKEWRGVGEMKEVTVERADMWRSGGKRSCLLFDRVVLPVPQHHGQNEE